MIVVVDFGSQTCHLIARRIKELGATVSIIEPEQALTQIKKIKPQGIILSGGPASVYEKGAPTLERKIFTLGIPILGICYGQQLIAHLLRGKVRRGKVREDGPATLKINLSSPLLDSISPHSRIWMSHGDEVVLPPPGFSFIGQSDRIQGTVMANEQRRIYGVQFHPEVEHTEHGLLILKNFLEHVCQVTTTKYSIDLQSIINKIKKDVGSSRALAAVSGGLDSTVAATLVARAIGKRLLPVYVDSGLMRTGTTERVKDFFQSKLDLIPIILKKEDVFLKTLKGVADPEEKRKRIGKLYIDLFQQVIKRYKNVDFLVQGTIYSDVIESKGTKNAVNIKSHHNVGGLPKNLKLKLLEPIRFLYTDQVRQLAKKLAIPPEIINQQPHPGPGFAIRIMGEVTPIRLLLAQQADQIVVEEVKKAGWYKKLLHSFPVLTGVNSTSVRGDGRFLGEVVALRLVTSKDRMTADWGKVPYQLLQKITSRLTSEVEGISRVVYDITTKPPATMEWE
ncbi:glutamine-hydrolyzing GMP synthase [Candidatus Microgenomates bacterium]|nr:glutamine-hydrolyzing GMP synthase [Candidatus Microgenomates bacterium]MBI2622450.1 glutamine-hydrolyzing GMP synthase [Candidatus Microgenomates bacterium]